VAEFLNEHYPEDAPGCAIAVVRDGRVIDTFVRGISDAGVGKKINIDSRFYIASVSKQFTAACVHILAREGKLSLDDDVRKYVPELPDYGDRITVRHLIHHRSGLRGFLELMALAGMDLDAPHTAKESLDLVCRQKELNFRPGSEFLYSNTGYLLLGVIVERVTGRSLSTFARENLFEPLGMTQTEFRDESAKKLENDVVGHDRTTHGYQPHPTKFQLVGSGGVVTTIGDLTKWILSLENGRLIDREFVSLLHDPIRLEADQGLDPKLGHYAAGWLIGDHGSRNIALHTGGSFGFSACIAHFPAEKFAVVVLSNRSGEADRTSLQIADAYLPPKFEETSSTAGIENGPRHGRFFFTHPRTGELVVSIVRPDTAKLAVAAWDIEMQSDNDSTLVSRHAAVPVTAQFVYHEDQPADLRVTIGDQAPFECKGFLPRQTSQEQIETLAGTWKSAELGGAKIELRVGRGQIQILDRPLLVDGPLVPLSPDLFVTNEGLRIDVRRDAKGEPVKISVSTKSARGIAFTR
jgi:CubicO group peptidase (beta-lactamase class C family)